MELAGLMAMKQEFPTDPFNDNGDVIPSSDVDENDDDDNWDF